ncbi:MAG TPA: hypothetical protein VHJ39_03960 [Solirubrobacteraceae bacterium]|jgi:hypothetical protein|nr:hypothetical protein [Solirubrobacteraceae bacterium]
MTREQAEARAAELNREHPDRHAARWIARAAGDGWEVARVSLPGGARIDPLTATTEAKPRPQPAEDPRSALGRNVGGPYAG